MACPRNILDVEPRCKPHHVSFPRRLPIPILTSIAAWVWLVVLFMALQIGILLLQDFFGPTFFLPRKMVKQTGYDYHPSIPLPDPEAPEQTLGDCAICMDAIEVDASLRQRSGVEDEKEKERGRSSGFGRSGTLWAQAGVRKSYSLAPCHHLFVRIS